MNARWKIERWHTREDSLSRDGGDGRHPSKGGPFAEAKFWSLFSQYIAEHDPLFKSKAVGDDERDLARGVVEKSPCEIPWCVVYHHRWVGRLVVEPGVAAFHPGEKGSVHIRAKFDEPLVKARPRGDGHLQPESAKFRPAVGECEPIVMPCAGTGYRIADGFHQSAEPPRFVRLGVGKYPHSCPLAAKSAPRPVIHRRKRSLNEQVVDIDTNVIVIEWQLRRTFDLEAERSAIFSRTASGAYREAVQKQWPALLKKGKEGLPIRDDGLQWPSIERSTLPQRLRKAII